MSNLKVGDVVIICRGCREVGEITYLDEVEGTAEVEVELYDYTTSYICKLSDLKLLNDPNES